MVRPILPSLLALACPFVSSCVFLGYLGGAPPNEEAAFNEQLNWSWGEDGAFCEITFMERVAGSQNLPAFIAAQEKGCAQGDAMACHDEADACLGGCVGAPRDHDRGMALLLRACDLGRPEACRDYADSLPAKSWWFFPNRARQRADARELELLQHLCLAGDGERCQRLKQRRSGLH